MSPLLVSAKLNGVDPQLYIADGSDRIGQGHPVNRLDKLLPWTKVVSA